MKVTIVAAYNTQLEMTKEFLDKMQWSVEDEDLNIHTILVHGYIGDEQDIVHPFVKHHIRTKNVSFCKTLNVGLLAVPKDTDYIFFVGNDSFPVEKGWLTKLINLAKETDGKIICPANDRPGMKAYNQFYLEDKGHYWKCNFFPSVAWLIPMKVFEDIALLDEDYVASCMYADNDYCKRVEQQYGEKQIIVSKHILLEHRVSVEGRVLHNQSRDMDVNGRIFRTKWK